MSDLENGRSKGNLFLGGVGMATGYIADMVAALREAGLGGVAAGSLVAGRIIAEAPKNEGLGQALHDLRWLMRLRDRPDDGLGVDLHGLGTGGPQFNLIGYSYGAVLAAQLAHTQARRDATVDHLVLIAAPLGRRLVEAVRRETRIGRTIVMPVDQQSDPITPSQSTIALAATAPVLLWQFLRGDGVGHFHYCAGGEEGRRRRRTLAARLRKEGLR